MSEGQLHHSTRVHLAQQTWWLRRGSDRPVDSCSGTWTVHHKNGTKYRIERDCSGALDVYCEWPDPSGNPLAYRTQKIARIS